MDRVHELLEEGFKTGEVLSFVVSGPISHGPRDLEACRKITGKSIALRGRAAYQFERFCGTKTTHKNLLPADAARELARLLGTEFRQAHVHTSTADVQISIGKDGEASISRKARTVADTPAQLLNPLQHPLQPAPHNRTRQYIIPEDRPCEFLHRLGVMTAEGRVIAARRDKFRQVNRFLEMVADVADEMEAEGPLRVVDFGCGKSYLTFALYHYFHVLRNREVEIVGLDLKADIIDACSWIAVDIGFEGLKFEVGDVRTAAVGDRADMVVALHACDTATDDALARAVGLNAKIILAAPCCQHELFKQLDNDTLRPMLKHGIVRERLTGLVTDSLRAALLEARGYTVRMLEFIDAEHTPKNVMIRAVRNKSIPASRLRAAQRDYETLRDFWKVHPSIERLLPSV